MAFPITITTGDFADQNFHHGPFISSGGDVYWIGRGTAANNDGEARALRSTDPDTDTDFTEQDSGNRPTLSDAAGTAIESLDCTQDGDLIHVVAQSTNASPYYARFSMATNTWVQGAVEVDSGANTTLGAAVSIVAGIGAADRIFVIYQGHRNKIMGTDYSKICYAYSDNDGVSWNNNNALHSSTADFYRACSAVAGASNSVHVHFHVGSTLYQYTIPAGLTPISTQTVTNAVPSAVNYPFGEAISFTRTSLRAVVAKKNSANQPSTLDYVSSVTPAAGANRAINSNVLTNTAITVAADGDTLHSLSVDDADGDLYHEDDGGSFNWAGTRTLAVAGTINKVSGNIYTRNGDVVFGYVYDDNGTVKYNEYLITAAPPTTDFSGSAATAATVNTPVSHRARTFADTVAVSASITNADPAKLCVFSGSADAVATVLANFGKVSPQPLTTAPTSASVSASSARIKTFSGAAACAATTNAPVGDILKTVSASVTAYADIEHACYIRIVPDIVGPTTEEWDAWGTLDQMVQTPVDQWSTAAIRNVGACARASASASGDFIFAPIGGEVKEFSASVSTTASLVAPVSIRIREVTDAVSTLASVTGAFERIVEVSGSAVASADVTAAGTLIATVQATVATAASVAGLFERIKDFSASVPTSAAVSGDFEVVSGSAATANTSAFVSAQATAIKSFSASVLTSANASGDFDAVSGVSASISTSASVNAPETVIIKGVSAAPVASALIPAAPASEIIRVFSASVEASAGVSNAQSNAVLTFQASLSTIASAAGSFELGGEANEPIIITSLGM